MVKIAKGNLVNTVPKSAFDNFFKSQGWEMVEGDYTPSIPIVEEKEVEEVAEEQEENSDEWDEVMDELKDDEVEKPLSDMNKEELISKANSLGMDITGLNTNKQLREAIKSFTA